MTTLGSLSIARILHPTDLSVASRVAFLHALRIAVGARAELEILHVAASREEARPEELPHVRDTLRLWHGLDGRGGVKVKKLVAKGGDPVTAIVERANEHPTDLIVMATHGPSAHGRSVARPAARRAATATLFVPHGAPGFVDGETGAVGLSRILIPVADAHAAHASVAAAAGLARGLDANPVEFTLLYVGEAGDAPTLAAPESAGWSWRQRARVGDVVEQIIAQADEDEAQLIVIATRGHDSLGDVLRGSTGERIVRAARCPVLAVPLQGGD
jgi:nucleotide-binding universal stress UspA family protein